MCFFSERTRSTIEEQLHPDFERQELPDLHRPVSRATAVRVHVAANNLGPEQPAPANLRFRKKVIDEWTQIMREPIIDWRRETRLGLPQNFRGQHPAHCFAEDVLRGWPPLAFQLPLRLHVPCDKFCEMAI